ncbi:hypothetical protein Tco_0319836 [Tanacetum coccineum]
MKEAEHVQKKTKLQLEQERLGYEEALRLQEQLNEEERQRIARVHEEANTFNAEEWDNIQAQIEADEELAQKLQAEERGIFSEVEKARLLVEMINEKKRLFAQQRAEQRRNKPMTQAQQRTYMCNYIKNMGSHTLQQLKKLSFDEIKELFETTMKRVKDFVPMENTDELKEEEEYDDHGDEGELGGFEKLTRAQRKRLRKQKLKEAASHRREIIGPQLPGKGDDDQQSEGARQNAAQRVESGNEHHRSKTSSVFVNIRGETPSCIKVKHRRMSKKKAMEKQKAYPTDLGHDTTHPGDKNVIGSGAFGMSDFLLVCPLPAVDYLHLADGFDSFCLQEVAIEQDVIGSGAFGMSDFFLVWPLPAVACLHLAPTLMTILQY